MFRFEDITYLYLLAVIPVLALLRFMLTRAQKKRLKKFGDPQLVRQQGNLRRYRLPVNRRNPFRYGILRLSYD